MKVFDFLQRTGMILLTILLLLLGYGLFSLVIAHGFVPFFVNVLRVIYLKNKGTKVDWGYWDKTYAKQIMSLSSFLLLVVISDLFINNISPSLLARYATTDDIAIFGIGFTVFGYVSTFSGAINGLFLPKVTAMNIQGENEKLRTLTSKVSVIQYAVLGFLVLGFVLLGQDFISLWVGDIFYNSYYVALALIIPNLFVQVQQIETTQLFAIGKLKYTSYMKLITAICSVLLSIILIPRFGAVGAACAIGFSTICFLWIGMNIIYKKHLNADVRKYLMQTIRFIFSFMIISVIFFLITEFVSLNKSWLSFLCKGILYSFLYIVFIWWGTLNKNERSYVKI